MVSIDIDKKLLTILSVDKEDETASFAVPLP
jgi:hypothetical protein